MSSPRGFMQVQGASLAVPAEPPFREPGGGPMSWLPADDPNPGDKLACDAIETVIIPRARGLGGFEVRRALASARRQMVGPFIFWDQMGPAEFLLGQGMDVRPHPHIGLATVTYLFDGASISTGAGASAVYDAPSPGSPSACIS